MIFSMNDSDSIFFYIFIFNFLQYLPKMAASIKGVPVVFAYNFLYNRLSVLLCHEKALSRTNCKCLCMQVELLHFFTLIFGGHLSPMDEFAACVH